MVGIFLREHSKLGIVLAGTEPVQVGGAVEVVAGIAIGITDEAHAPRQVAERIIGVGRNLGAFPHPKYLIGNDLRASVSEMSLVALGLAARIARARLVHFSGALAECYHPYSSPSAVLQDG